MVVLILVFTVFHVVLNLYLSFGWKALKESKKTSENVCFSVIVPVRNEEQVIERLLASLAFQDYPRDRFEVLLVNDFSDDNTASKIEHFISGSGVIMR